MKTISAFLVLFLGLVTLNAQNEIPPQDKSQIIIRCGSSFNNNKEPLYVVDGVPTSGKDFLKTISPDDIVSIQVLKNPPEIICYGSAGKNGVVLINTIRKQVKRVRVKPLPFKVYCVPNENWVLQQDIYNSLQARVPSLQLENKSMLSKRPSISIRSQEITTVILDGIRYDASVLNTLNPADIESIKVAPSVAATNYYANASNIH